jgi:hypothetical protein
MKKIALIVMVLFVGTVLTACSLVNQQDAHIYGVVMSVNLAEDEDNYQLAVNCSELGYMMIPISDHIYGQFGADYTADYVIQEGDLLEIWYSDARDVEILESYPGQFGKEPDHINVAKQNVSLEKDDGDVSIFEFPLSDVSYEYEFDIKEKNIGDEIYIWYATIIDYTPANVSLFTTVIESISEERVSFKIPTEFLTDFLMRYHEDNIVIYENIYIIDSEID